MFKRVEKRVAFGERLSQKTNIQHDITRSRCEIEQCRLLVLAAASKMDEQGPKEARDYISMVKIVAPQICHDVAERAMPMHGGMGVTESSPIPRIRLLSGVCQIADGPDEVHMSHLARRTIRDNY